MSPALCRERLSPCVFYVRVYLALPQRAMTNLHKKETPMERLPAMRPPARPRATADPAQLLPMPL